MVELQVNVLNQLVLLRNSTFKDPLSYIDEAVQNAQRAGATEFWVEVYETGLTLSNNGAELDDPQKLFTIAESGWNDEVKAKENPFGVGFMSNVSVSPYIRVNSGPYEIIFDVNKMLETKDTTLHVTESEPLHDGFKITLEQMKPDKYAIRKRLEQLAAYIHELDIYYCGDLLEKKELIDRQGREFELPVKEAGVLGILVPSKYSHEAGLKIFHKGRFVKELSNYPYIAGTLHVDNTALNFTAPDRRDIIQDDKYKEFTKLLDLYIEFLVTSIAVSSSSSRDKYEYLLGRYSRYIDWYSIPVMVYDLGAEDNIKLLAEPKEPDTVEPIPITEGLIESSIPGAEHFEQLDTSREDKVSPQKGSSSSYYSSGDEEFISARLRKAKKYDKFELNSKFFIRKQDISDFATAIRMLAEFKVELAVAHNSIEVEALETRGLSDIRELRNCITTHVDCTNPFGAPHERRAYNLLKRFGFEAVIGDLQVSKKLHDADSNELASFSAQSDYEWDVDKRHLWLDRKLIPDTLQEGELSVPDLLFIIDLVNKGVFSHSILKQIH